MLSPERAPVKPRVFIPHSGEVLPLEEVIRGLIAGGVRGLVHLLGSAGSGKTTALRHLAAVLPADAPVVVREEEEQIYGVRDESDRLIIWATSKPAARPGITYRLAPWSTDDLIEYLLAVHRQECASVIERLRSAGADPVWSAVELWRIVLDEMAGDASIADGREAIRRRLHQQISNPGMIERARYTCLAIVIRSEDSAGAAVAPPLNDFDPNVRRLLRHPEVQLLLAAERIAADLEARADCEYLERPLPRQLIRSAAAGVRGHERTLQHLHDIMAGASARHAMAASLLRAADPAWVPTSGTVPVLTGAHLDHALWSGVQLPQVAIREADLSHADLRRACLDGADASAANLSYARFGYASMHRFSAVEANLIGADLSYVRAEAACWDRANLENARMTGASLAESTFRGTKLTGAELAKANLARAVFAGVEITDADFTSADLSGACLARSRLRDATFSHARFTAADLSFCNLEGMELTGVNCCSADFSQALLTETVLTDANLQGAILRGCGLGDVNMERACLRDADLREATFHMGSSRSGLLFTPIASEGSRTGFYTDDADELNFKAPEEIRKANLRGADLRGAVIEGVDFYLVDLRDALYDAEQEQHFRRCRAILESRAEGEA